MNCSYFSPRYTGGRKLLLSNKSRTQTFFTVGKFEDLTATILDEIPDSEEENDNNHTICR